MLCSDWIETERNSHVSIPTLKPPILRNRNENVILYSFDFPSEPMIKWRIWFENCSSLPKSVLKQIKLGEMAEHMECSTFLTTSNTSLSTVYRYIEHNGISKPVILKIYIV